MDEVGGKAIDEREPSKVLLVKGAESLFDAVEVASLDR